MNIFKSSFDKASAIHSNLFLQTFPTLQQMSPQPFLRSLKIVSSLTQHPVPAALSFPKLAVMTALGTGKRPCRAWRWPRATTIPVGKLSLCSDLGEVGGWVGILSSLRVFRDGTFIAFLCLATQIEKNARYCFYPVGEAANIFWNFVCSGSEYLSKRGMEWIELRFEIPMKNHVFVANSLVYLHFVFGHHILMEDMIIKHIW